MSHLTEYGFELMKQGAEAKLYKGSYLGKPAIVKERFSKAYRHPTLDASLTKERTKAETKSIIKCQQCGIKTPSLYLVDYENGRIYMEYIQNNITVKDYIINLNDKIDSNTDTKICMSLLEKLTVKIGTVLALMHKNNIIHGDLTTSNMLLTSSDDSNGDKINYDDGDIVLIDFGLSHTDNSAEDKGVDLYVLERALTSTHSTLPHLFENILQNYKQKNKGQSKEVIEKFEEVRLRGRKRTMVG